MTTATTTPPTAQVMADRIVRRNEVLKMLGIGHFNGLAESEICPLSSRFPEKNPSGHECGWISGERD